MIPLTGYADRLSVRPAETIRFHVSNATGSEIASAQIVRVISADANPAGPGIRTVQVDAEVRAIAPCQAQTVTPGSYGVADLGSALEGLGALTVIATICPTRLAGSSRPILTAFSPQGGGFGLLIAEDGSACAMLGGASGAASKIATGHALREGAWARVWLTWDSATSTLSVGQQPLLRGAPDGEARVASTRHDGAMPAAGPKLLIGAAGGGGRSFNGRIERPMLFDRVLDSGEMARAA
ncbi:MAG TPA: LamG-like jellyroll fold domain-containing protein, partial [Hyphomicrobiaceae bacterium]|nr:LamG-like jellyroll fold domain-containing protein [Hyphomicrobiaceae bacterium]